MSFIQNSWSNDYDTNTSADATLQWSVEAKYVPFPAFIAYLKTKINKVKISINSSRGRHSPRMISNTLTSSAYNYRSYTNWNSSIEIFLSNYTAITYVHGSEGYRPIFMLVFKGEYLEEINRIWDFNKSRSDKCDFIEEFILKRSHMFEFWINHQYYVAEKKSKPINWLRKIILPEIRNGGFKVIMKSENDFIKNISPYRPISQMTTISEMNQAHYDIGLVALNVLSENVRIRR